MANLSGNSTTGSDIMESTASACNGNYELSDPSGDSASTISNCHNRYTKEEIIGVSILNDNDELNQLTEEEIDRHKQAPDSMSAAVCLPQRTLEDSELGDIAPETVPDIETKENIKSQDTEEDLQHWQVLKRTTIEGQRCKLVPYTAEHVPTYNKWLNDPYIQQMTQTEPYSLSQEYEYQKEWETNENQFIFIILDRSLDDAMAGDINLFIKNEAESIGELNIMIAEEKSRRKGIATEAVSLILDFARKHFELKQFIAKIQHDNDSSIKLFKKSGFVETEYIEQFKEYTFTLTFEDEQSPNGISKGKKRRKKKKREHTDSESESELLERHKGRLHRVDDDDCSSLQTKPLNNSKILMNGTLESTE